MITHDEMQTALMSRYPAVLAQLRGFEFREGWAPIIDSLCHVLASLEPLIQPAIIKEKFGELRVQGDDSSPQADAVIRVAEAMSCRTCELSGQRGRLGIHSRRVWQTLAPGMVPDFRIETSRSGAIPMTQTIQDVAARYPGRLTGDLSGIAEGYADLLDAALAGTAECRFSIRVTFDGLAFSAEATSPGMEAVCRLLGHLSGSVDPATGALVWRA